jgi:DNA-binding winged helix-turn-helix (wHTH) protein
MRIRFGECLLDSGARQLLVRGAPVHLTPKALELLDLLLSCRPRALTKDEIQERLWPASIVAEGTLTSLVAEVRSAIEDDARKSRFVRTVHRYGYAFCGEANETKAPEPVSSLQVVYRLVWGTRDIALAGETVLGRDLAGDVFIDHPSISRRHARITVSRDGAVVEDLGSKNGTFVRGERISAPRVLRDEDEIRVGSIPLFFRIVPVPGTTATIEG